MNRATKLRNTERARIQRVTAASLRWSPGLRTPIHRVTPPPPGSVAAPTAAGAVPQGETLPNGGAATCGGTHGEQLNEARSVKTTQTPPFPERRRDELERQILERAGTRPIRRRASSFASFFLAWTVTIGVLGAMPPEDASQPRTRDLGSMASHGG